MTFKVILQALWLHSLRNHNSCIYINEWKTRCWLFLPSSLCGIRCDISVCLSVCPSHTCDTARLDKKWGMVFGRPFIKRFALCYRTVVMSVCPVLSVTLVYCGQTVGWIKLKLGVEVGLGPGDIVLDEDPAPPPPKGHSPQFSAHVHSGQTAGWTKMPLGTDVGLGPGDIVLDGNPGPPKRGTDTPNFRPMCIVAKRLDRSRCLLVRR